MLDVAIIALGILMAIIHFGTLSAVISKIEYLKHGPSGDASAYFFHYQDWKNGTNSCLLGPGLKARYPLFFFFLMNLFKDELLFKKPFLLNQVIFFVLLLIVSSFLWIESGYLKALVFFISFVVFSDISIIKSYNIHFFSLSPRFLYILIGSFSVFIVLFLESNFLKLIAVMLCSLVLISGTHFSRQYLFFVFIPFIFFVDVLIGAIIVSFIFFILLLFGELRKIFFEHINQFIFQIGRFKKLQRKVELNYDIKSLIKFFFGVNVFEGFSSFFNLLIAIFLAFYFQIGNALAILSITLFVSGIISLRYFQFLGEPWRYIPYTTLFVFPLLLSGLFDSHPLVFLMLLVLRFSWNISSNFKATQKLDKHINLNKYIFEILEPIKEEVKNAYWFANDFHMSSVAVMLGFGKKATQYPIGTSGNIPELVKTHPLIDPDIFFRENINADKVNYAIIRKSVLEKSNLKKFLDSWKIIRENEHFYIAKVK